MTGTITTRPIKAVATPTSSDRTIIVSQTTIARLLRSTAFTDVTIAVMLSTSRCMIIGNENALAEKVMVAKTAPMVDPKAKKLSSCIFVISPSVGKNTLTMTAALAQTMNMTRRTRAKTISLPKLRFKAARMLRAIKGG